MHNIIINPIKDTIDDMTSIIQTNQARSSMIGIDILRT